MTNSTKLLIPLFALAILLASCSSGTKTPTPGTPSGSTSAPANAKFNFDGTILSGKHVAVIKTSMGDITVELDADAAPKTVTNFITLAKAGFYNGLTFHRVINNFMIQGGDPTGTGRGGESIFGPSFADEINADAYGINQHTLQELAQGQPLPAELQAYATMTLKQYYTEKEGYTYTDGLPSIPFTRGVIAMANAGANTNGSQFFITQVDTPSLAGKHTVFGKVTAGLDVVDAIAKTPTGQGDVPVKPVTFTVQVQN